MSEKPSARDLLYELVKQGKEHSRLGQTIVGSITTVGGELRSHIERLDKKLDDLNTEIRRIDKIVKEQHVYTDEEIYKMKATMSWRRLHQKTNIPLSTLQYRYRKYRDYLMEQEDITI